MADSTRKLNIWINGKEVENQVASITKGMNQLRNELAHMTIGSKEYIEQTRKIQTLQGVLNEHKKLQGQVATGWEKIKQNILQIGAGSALGNFFSNIGSKIANGFSKAITIIKEFATGVSELRAITGASGKDLEYLKEKAMDLAAEYGKSAREIVNAMKLVGSAKPELLENVQALSKVTEAVLTLSQASSMNLATATSSLTTIMNQFGHGAELANEDINILAAGSKYGAVEVDYLSNAISKVGTVAKSANISLEQTTAVMELFGEKGVKAETAGTGFKSILVGLQADTANYTNGVFDLNKAIDNNQSISQDNIALQEKFGKEFFNLAQILLQGKDRFIQLTEQVTNTNTAFEQAAIATDNWQGDLDKAGGAWDKFILSIESGNGIISKTLRNVTQIFTGLVGIMTNLNKGESLSLQKERQSQDVNGTAANWTQSEVGKLKGIQDETKRKQIADKIIIAYEKQISDYDMKVAIM